MVPGSTFHDYTFNLNAKSKAAAPDEEGVLSVFVSFRDADPHCDNVTFSKLDLEAFTDREIRVLINANSLGHQWNFMGEIFLSTCDRWLHSTTRIFPSS
jgi:hypothetical protein